MTIDTYFTDHVIYANDLNRASAVCFGLHNAVKIYGKTILTQKFEQLKEEYAKFRLATASPSGQIPQIPVYFEILSERAVEDFLIGTFCEIMARSLLLDKGFLIHEIDPKKSNSGAIKLLGIRQSAKIPEPILVSDVFATEKFSVEIASQRKCLKCLKLTTISYTKLFSPKYVSELGCDRRFIDLALNYQERRNQIHFPYDGLSERVIPLKNLRFEEVQNIIESIIVDRAEPLFNSLISLHKFRYSTIRG